MGLRYRPRGARKGECEVKWRPNRAWTGDARGAEVTAMVRGMHAAVLEKVLHAMPGLVLPLAPRGLSVCKLLALVIRYRAHVAFVTVIILPVYLKVLFFSYCFERRRLTVTRSQEYVT